jgi:predicted dehydrogenase
VEPLAYHGVIDEANGRRVIVSDRGNYALYYQNLAQAILNGTESMVSPQSALEVIKVINACYESHSKGKKILL